MMDLTACFTGHRHLPPDKRDSAAASLGRAIEEAYKNGYRRFMCGGALGFDTIAALQVLDSRKEHPDIKLILAIPCLDQAKRWYATDIWSIILRFVSAICIHFTAELLIRSGMLSLAIFQLLTLQWRTRTLNRC